MLASGYWSLVIGYMLTVFKKYNFCLENNPSLPVQQVVFQQPELRPGWILYALHLHVLPPFQILFMIMIHFRLDLVRRPGQVFRVLLGLN